MKACFALPCDDYYSVMFKVFLRSLIEIHGGKFDYRIYVFCDHMLTWKIRQELKAIYSNLIYHEVDPNAYTASNKLSTKYYSIECFNLWKYGEEKVISIDADCICISPVDQLVAETCDIGMPKERQRPEMFSSGVMVIGKKYLNAKTYRELMKADYTNVDMFGRDMRHYNCFFKGKITKLNYMYDVVNTEVQYLKEDCREFKDIVFLHLVNKPMERDCREKLGQEIYDLWMRYHLIDYPGGYE